MTDAQRAATQSLLFAILACKASITPEIQARVEKLSADLRGEPSLADLFRGFGGKA